MADGPWRCTQCGTINEPVANSCRTCGKWPSLFDLQDSVLDDAGAGDAREPAPTAGFPAEATAYEPEALEPEPFEPDVLEPEAYEPEPVEREPYELEEDSADETPRRSGRQLLRFVVPLAIVAWIVISNLLNR